MKLYLLNLLVLSIVLTYKAQGIRLGKVALSDASDQHNIFKISSLKGSIQDDQLLAKSAPISSGINRKLMTKTSSGYATTISKNQKNKHDPKPELKSSQVVSKEETSDSLPENSKNWKKDVMADQYPDVINIMDMDYTSARKKSPIHN